MKSNREGRMDIRVGDRIKVRVPVKYAPTKSVWRVVRSFWANGNPCVHLHGWSNFIIKPEEIEDHQPQQLEN